MKLKYSVLTSIAAMAAAVASVSCTDTWDDHYSVNGTVPTATLWESMQNDESLRPFMRVLDSCGYKSMLDSRQTFTVWAPVITDQEAQDWIDRYKADRANSDVPEDENTTVVQFIQNHIAMYTRPISSLTEDESIRMLNGKRMQLSSSKFNDEVNLVGQGVASSNGMLYKVDAPVAFVPNIWERIRANVGGDEGLDSLVAFFRSWQHEELDEEASVPGGIVDGQTIYLDSVMYSYNTYFTMMGDIESEDSLYWFLAPTNKIWREHVDTYKNYFVYHTELGEEGDSLQNLYAKELLTANSFFSVREQEPPFNEEDPDSIISTTYSPYDPDFSVFEWPKRSGGILEGLTPQECSNGLLYTATDWRMKPTDLNIMSTIKVEAEYMDNYSTVTLSGDSTAIQASPVTVSSSMNDTLTVSSGGYLYVTDSRSGRTNQPEITFEIPNTLSNCPYDIKVVFASPLAADTAAIADAQLKRQISARLRYYTSPTGNMIQGNSAVRLVEDVDVDATRMDTITVATGRVFPVCNFGEEDSRVLLTIQSISGRTTPAGYSKNLLIDCVIFEPHPTEGTSDEN